MIGYDTGGPGGHGWTPEPAADRLIANSRHGLNASDPVTALWRDVHAGCRLAVRLFAADGQTPS